VSQNEIVEPRVKVPSPTHPTVQPEAAPVENDDLDADEEVEEGEEDGRDPKLYVDVNVANFGLQRIVVYEGDTVDSLVSDFVKRCPIDEFMVEKLKTLLQ
jgi:hypothetical protein